jgi:predicted XRE-type DNA-binding protein
MHDLGAYRTVFEQMGYEEEDGTTLLMRLQLIKQIKEVIETKKWSQREAARRLRVAQPRIAEIVGLRVDKFSVELLTKYLQRLGKKVSLVIK